MTSSLLNGAFWNLIQQIGQLGIQLISTIVLARYLSAEEYGTFGILLIFVNISNMLADSGISGYLIKKKNCTLSDFNTLFIYNLIISFTLYNILYISAPIIAHFYKLEKLINLIRVSGISIIFYALSIVQYTILLKRLAFKKIALINVTAGIISFIIALYLASHNYGVWSLIGQQLSMVVLTSIFYIFVNRFIPSLSFSSSSFKEQFQFGVNLLLSNILQTLSSTIGNNFIAKFININTAGFYVQASRMQNYPTSMLATIIDKTLFPIFSKQEIKDLAQYSNNTNRIIFAIAFPSFCFIICFANDIIKITLGNNWLDIVPLFQLLMISSFPMLIKAVSRNILKSLGKTKDIFIVEKNTFLILIISLSILSIFHNIYIITFSFIITQLFSMALIIEKIIKNAGYNRKEYYINILTFIPISCILLLPVLFDYTFIIKLAIFIVLTVITIYIYIILGNNEYHYIQMKIKQILIKRNNYNNK